MKVPRALTILRSEFNIDLIGKVIVVFIFLGPILTPLLWLSGWPVLTNIAEFGWSFGRAICSYTGKSFTIAGLPLMVCARCTGIAFGLVTTGLLYHYTPLVKRFVPQRRLYLAALIALLFLPWLIDSALERLQLWITDYWLMFPTGFLAGIALVIAPLLFSPLKAAAEDDDEEDFEENAPELYPLPAPENPRRLELPRAS
jgi:uncharacterized membrane protein